MPGLEFSADSAELVIAPKRLESLYGILCSLTVHVLLIVALGFLVLESTDHEVGSLLGLLGPADADAPAEFILDSEVNLNPGGSTDPLDSLSSSSRASDIAALASLGSLSGGGTGAGAGEGDGDGEGIAVPAVGVPGHAVTKGSFSAWTVPEDPEPGIAYVIMIQVRLPGNVQKGKLFPAKDISGMVIGTDGYKKVIRFRTTDKVEVKDGVVQFQVLIPGAAQLVRDTIRIESKMLKEKQKIELVF